MVSEILNQDMSMSDNNLSTPIIDDYYYGLEKSCISKLNSRILPISFSIHMIINIVQNNITFVASDFCNALNLTYFEYGLGASIFISTFSILVIPGTTTTTSITLNY